MSQLGDGVGVTLDDTDVVLDAEIVGTADHEGLADTDAEAESVGEIDAIAVSVVVPEKEGDADQLGSAE